MIFANKYRPNTLSDFVGQDVVVKTLTNAFDKKKLHHAYLMVGSPGSGKTSCARVLAAMENCENSPGLNPCGKCKACKLIHTGKHPDVIEVDAASDAGKVEQIRALKTGAQFNSMASANKKYYIIDECLPKEALVTMEDGSQIAIGELVEDALTQDVVYRYVASRDMKTGKTVYQPIKRYIKIPNDKQMYEITVKDENGQLTTLRITGNHNVFIDNGTKVKAENLEVGQKVFLK